MTWRIAAGALAALSLGTLADAKSPNLIGGWGGPHAGITFQGGLADVQFDCATGTIDVPVYPAKDGAFSARGTVRTGAPGPVRVGQIFRSEHATYDGRVVKGVMTLTVTLESGSAAGPFTLVQGAAPQLTRCL
jgi:hypothetical protein